MIIYVEGKSQKLINELIVRGYDVTSTSNKKCDAIICNIKEGELSKINIEFISRKEGTIIIDLAFKNIDEIENILNDRVFNVKN